MPGPTRPIQKAALRRIARTSVPYRAQIVWSALAVLVSATLGLLSPFFLQTIANQALLAHRLDVITRYTLDTFAPPILGAGPLRSVGILPLFAFLAMKVGGMARGVRGKTQAKMADVSATMQETLSVSGMLLTKISGRRTLALQKFTAENQDLTNLQIQMAMI